MTKIHPTAVVHASARLADHVEVGPYAIIEPDSEIGEGTVIRGHAVIHRYTKMGKNNLVDHFVSLGAEPQDYKYKPQIVSHLIVGDNNVFREGVTISRATGPGECTIVENNTYWMIHTHAGHNAVIRDNATLVNGSAVAGHVELGKGAILSAHVVVHQFCWIGELVMSQGNSATSCHVPPYVIFGKGGNNVVGLNTVGIRRAENLTDTDREQIKEAFRITYRSGLTPAQALEKMEACTDWNEVAGKFRTFLRRVLEAKAPHNRALCPMLHTSRGREGMQTHGHKGGTRSAPVGNRSRHRSH